MTLPFDQTLGLSHPFSVGKNVHAILGNPNSAGTFYADIAARDADTAFQVTENIGKAVAVTSPLSIFVLMSIGPVVWLELSSTLTDSFLELNDTPSSYSGQSLQGVRVNAGETALEFHESADTFLELTDTPASYSGQALKVARVNAGETALEFFTDAGGDVVGPAGATDNALVRFDLATGKLIQNSLGILNDSGELSGLTQLFVDNLLLDGTTIFTSAGDLILAPFNSVIDANTSTIKNVVDPTSNQDAATKKYVDDQIITQDSFLELTDTPSSYSGQSNHLINVNAVADALEFNVATLNFAGELAGLTKLNVDNLLLDGNTLSTGSGNLILDSSSSIIDAGTNTIINVVDPTSNQDAATKKYVDDQILTQDTFLELTDTPSSYSGQANTFLKVNAAADALEYAVGLFEVGGNFGMGESLPEGKLHIKAGSAGITTAPAGSTLVIESNISNFITLLQPNAFGAGIIFGDPAVNVAGAFVYGANDAYTWSTVNNTVKMTLASTGQLLIDATTNIPLIVKMDAGAGNPSYMEYKDVTSRLFMGYLSSDFTTSAMTQAQIGATADGGFVYATRGNFAGGGHTFYTPNAALDTLIQRLDIADITGNVKIGIGTALGLLDVAKPLSGIPSLTGHYLSLSPSTFTDNDTAASGTASTMAFNSIAAPTLAASNTGVTTVNAVTLLLNPPVAGTNQTITNPYALWANGRTRFDGELFINSGGINVTSSGAITAFFQNTVGTQRAVFQTSGTNKCFVDLITNGLGSACLRYITNGLSRWAIGVGVTGPAVGTLVWSVGSELNTAPKMFLEADGLLTTVGGRITKKTNVADANYTILSSDYRIAITSITAARIITIPTAEIAKGSATEAREWKFKDQSGSVNGSNKITIVTEGSETIDGASDLTLDTPYFDFSLYADGSNVYVEAA